MEHTDEVNTYVTVFLTKERVLDRTLNYLVLQKGLAKLDR